MNTDWITIGEAADLLQVSRDTLRRWEKKGKIKSYRSPSNRRMYKRPEILDSYQITDTSDTDINPHINTQAASTANYPFSSLPKITQNPIAPPTPFRPNTTNYPIPSSTNFKPFSSINSSSTDLNSNLTKTSTVEIKDNDYTTLSPLPKPVTPSIPTPPPTYTPNFDYPKPSYFNEKTTNTNPTSSLNTNLASTTTTPSNNLNPTVSTPDIKTQIQNLQPISSSNPPNTSARITPPSPPFQPSPINNWNPVSNSSLASTLNYSSLTTQEIEPKDNTVKILKFITAILITILIILAIAIFSIIFMQYT